MSRIVSLALASFTMAVALVAGCKDRAPKVDRADVERVVSTLSADSMMGRRTFTPGIEKAARFLEAEFSAIGLDPLGGEGYRQSFKMYSLSPLERSVTLDGSSVEPAHFFLSSSQQRLELSIGDVEVVVVGEGGDLRQAFSNARSESGSSLLLVHPEHESTFARYQQFTSAPSRVTELGGRSNVVAVLTPSTTAKSLSVAANYNVDQLDLANIAAKITGKRTDEYVLFSAHYDHIGVRPSASGDSIANGANDDASGVAAVIELARLFHAKGTPARTLLFAAFTGEEVGGYGSRHFSEQLDPDQIVAMFNIEMIGKPAVSGPNTAWITGFDRSDFGQILQRAVEGSEYSFYADPYPDQNLFYRSDNATLARLGVPAHSISTTPIDVDKDYHQVSDQIETLDLDHLTNTIRAIAAGAETIVSGAETPTRVNPAAM